MARPNMMPTVGNAQVDNQNALSDLKDDARGLFRAAKEKIEMDSVGGILEKVTGGGSGKGKTSSDFEGLAALLTAVQGPADKKLDRSIQMTLDLLNRKDLQHQENGGTRARNIDELLELKKLEILDRLGGSNQGVSDQSGIIAAMTAMFKIFVDMKDSGHQATVRHLEEKVEELRAQAGYQSPYARQLEHLGQQMVSQAVASGQRGAKGQLADLKDLLEVVDGFAPFQKRTDPNGVTPEERMFNRNMDFKADQMRADDRQHRREHFVRHHAPEQWGKGLANAVNGFMQRQPLTEDSTLSGMAGIFGGGALEEAQMP